MKLAVIGFGQCGCNIADEFYAINNYAKSFFNRRIEIVTDAFAVNTDEADLAGFRHIPNDRRHRILLGTIRTFGHGVGKINVDATKIIKESHSVVTDTILKSKKFHENDGIIAVASGGGGTGSGTIGWAIKELKERVEKPVYALIVLPFGFEEEGDTSYAVTNTATCLKTVSQYADAVFLVDNERFRRTDSGLAQNFKEINREIVRNFYDLCCAGEERKAKYVGSKVVDAGDIKQTLEDISTIGRGEINLSTFYRWKKENFREGVKQRSSTAEALQQAENNLGLKIEMEDARKILALVTAPKDIITLAMLEEISSFLQDKSPKSIVRIGDYPRRAKEISVTLIASKLTKVARVEALYLRAENLFKKQEEISRETEEKIKQMWETSKNVPILD
ncbi:MAG: cell division protein FtsZ [Dehalococcoidales bacterium]|nr:cell division protein FtsZ [Dehalococcoidales bacterium]